LYRKKEGAGCLEQTIKQLRLDLQIKSLENNAFICKTRIFSLKKSTYVFKTEITELNRKKKKISAGQ
jgi:hypothetical protein